MFRLGLADAAVPIVNVTAADDGAASGTTLTLPAIHHTTGNFLVVLVKYEGAATTVSVSDSAGNTYTGLTQYSHSNGDLHVRIFYATNITGGSANVVTVTWSAARAFRKAAVQQYFGINQSSPFDQENSGEGSSGTSMSTGNVTTTQANELFVAIAGEYSPQGNYTAGASWMRRVDFNVDYGGGGSATEDRLVSSAGTYNATMTQPNSAEWLMAMATFKVVNPDLIAWWKIDDGSGTSVADSSGTSNTGTLGNGGCSAGSGSCPTWSSSGRHGAALSFDGSDDYVNFGEIDSVRGLTEITVSLWVKAANTNSAVSETHFADQSDCFGNANSGGFEMLAGAFTSHKPTFLIVPQDGSPSSYVYADGVTTIDDTNWHHLTGVYDGTNIYLYVDGKVDGTTPLASVALASTNMDVEIGGNCNGHGGLLWEGLIDDVRIYNRALSAGEVRKLFHQGNAIHWSQD